MLSGLKTDVVTLFDIDFSESRLDEQHLRALEAFGSPADVAFLKPLGKSFGWIFYQEADESSVLPGMRRIDVSKLVSGDHANGAWLLVNAEFGVGVLAVWRTYDEKHQPHKIKSNLGPGKEDSEWKTLEKLREYVPIGTCERSYPFVALTGALTDFNRFCKDKAVDLGELFTGNLEHEPPDRLARYIEEGNISTRGYERLYLRWTDCLAIYNERKGKEERTLLTMLRAVQVYETCILVRRLVLTVCGRMERRTLLPTVQSGRQLDAARRIRRQFLVAIPVQSEEASHLMGLAYDRFGMPALWAALDDAAKTLDARFQWSKAWLLGMFGVVVYVAEKLKLFEWLASHMPWTK
jgi:hypothetical protein